MTFEDFLASCQDSQPPVPAGSHLTALWYDKRGEWELAHEEIQDGKDILSAAIHAYLHRKEGDNGNARYWYATARRKPFQGSLQEEWESLAKEVCEQ